MGTERIQTGVEQGDAVERKDARSITFDREDDREE
jgi:hypothetical protein